MTLAGRHLSVGEAAPDFFLTFSRRPPPSEQPSEAELTGFVMPEIRRVKLDEFRHRIKMLNIFPSVDTPVCAASMHACEQYAKDHPRDALLMISADLPFAFQRFCADFSIKNVFPMSLMGEQQFARDYGVLISDGTCRGLCARACLVLDAANVIRHIQITERIEDSIDFDAAFAAMDAARG